MDGSTNAELLPMDLYTHMHARTPMHQARTHSRTCEEPPSTPSISQILAVTDAIQ